MPEQPQTSNLIPYRIAVRTATVAAIFSLVVAALLLYDFFHRAMKDPFTMKDPAQTSALEVLKAAQKQQPDCAPLVQEIRNLDQQSRDEYFRQQAFTLSGGVLLCGGIIVALAAAKWAVTLQRKHPQVLPPAAQRDWEATWTPAARWTVSGLFVVLAATAAGLILPLHATLADKPDGQAVAAAGGEKATGKGSAEKTAEGKAAPTAKSAPTGTSATAPGPVKATTTAPREEPAPRDKPVARENPATTEKPPKERTPSREEAIREETPREKPVIRQNPAPTVANQGAGVSAEELARAWPCFRGRGGSGISPYTNVPDDWDGPSGKNIVWKSPIPLPGNSSPVVVAGRIFFTGADDKQRQVFCYEAKTGKLLWQRDVPSTPDSRKAVKVTDDAGYAACTMASNGRYVAAIFANGDLAAYDLDGKLAWSQSLGIPNNSYGHAASLSIYKNLLLVPFDQATAKAGRSKLRALDIATGHSVWEQTRAVPSSWTTPIVISAAGRDQVVTAASPWIIAYDAASGKELWRVKGKEGDVAPSPVSAGNVVFEAASDSAPLIAIRADGSGDVTASHVLWKGEDNTPDICSPLATAEFVFLLTSEGLLTCYDTHKGNKLWEEDLNDFKCKSSPSMVGKQLYLFEEAGKCWILEPGRTGVKRVRQVNLGEGCVTCPAFQDGRMYVRGKKNLICIGQGN
jgi:outer membrane protein assembly factor BamB